MNPPTPDRIVTALVLRAQPIRELQDLQARVTDSETRLAERTAEYDRVNGDLTIFTALYRHHIGTLHDELDRLHLDIAEAELGFMSSDLRDKSAGEPSSPAVDPDADVPSAPRFTSDTVRLLFREVARAIHPDLAGDDDARSRRHALMVAANQAYALGDAGELRRILERWARSPDEVQGLDEASMRLRLERRLVQIDDLMETCARDLAELTSSPLYELKARIDEASAEGRDLMADMVRRLKRDIMAASNRLDAMRFTP